jgi:UDP-2,4-diacetamido-2,4,6-trideoxy-beta-L-altropyranose hydrolase
MTIALRIAQLEDCERVWQWNFAPDVRAWSKSTEPVTLADHARWFTDRMNTGGMWIIEAAGKPVGVVRLDRADTGDRVSIALATDARGRGIGRRALELACRQSNGVVIAEILADNISSRTCFESCGFVAVETRGNLVSYRREQGR